MGDSTCASVGSFYVCFLLHPQAWPSLAVVPKWSAGPQLERPLSLPQWLLLLLVAFSRELTEKQAMFLFTHLPEDPDTNT